jgi:hypothetical protein
VGIVLGPIGWLILLLGPNPKKEKEVKERRARETQMQTMQEAHLSELRALRESLAPGNKNSEIKEDMFWVRLKDRDVGPVGKVDLLELYSSRKITLETQIARDTDSGERVYRLLSDEVPAFRKISL